MCNGNMQGGPVKLILLESLAVSAGLFVELFFPTRGAGVDSSGSGNTHTSVCQFWHPDHGQISVPLLSCTGIAKQSIQLSLHEYKESGIHADALPWMMVRHD